ncbi:GCN5-related N-acetyltransferase [Clostridium sp. DL-VIII]|uniref:GNAT family N-acetyltransferase n=1 Tax=Clostridium sp. DL-VIII TaxID=641107 RepID=UPI00023B07AF|nr:GNAT family N-acetyltransferase [Clostridium sp. DL-VIII]EHJ01068.1 GCN5-related N-acetyltransferase [Clostridium sp. DL-VIII]
MNIIIELGSVNDIDELEQLYDDLNDYLAGGINYPGWRKGMYPVRQNAIDGVNNKNLYVARYNGKIVGSLILSNRPETAYYTVKWAFESDYSDVLVVYTFAVHPDFLKSGIGRALINFSIEHGNMLHTKAIRLDVYEKNMPAIRLYEKCGFKYVDTVDLGLGDYGLDWFKLYERIL